MQVPIFLTRDKHAVLVKSFQSEPTENLLSYKDHLCIFPAFFEDYTETTSTPAAISLREAEWEGETNAHTQLLFYKLVYHKCYLVLYLNSKNHTCKN